MRVTIACPEGMISDANQLAMALGQGVADLQSFRAALWQDDQANRYACASFEADEDWVTKLATEIQRPGWDSGPTYAINLTGARRAQTSLGLWLASDTETQPPAALPDRLTAIAGLSAERALEMMALTAM
jgi:hypothetical protein